MAYLLVDANSGVVVNTIVVDEHTVASNWQAPAGQHLVSFDGAFSLGWIWDGSKAIDPNPVPAAVIASSNVTKVL
jgi:hypothetical protein